MHYTYVLRTITDIRHTRYRCMSNYNVFFCGENIGKHQFMTSIWFSVHIPHYCNIIRNKLHTADIKQNIFSPNTVAQQLAPLIRIYFRFSNNYKCNWLIQRKEQPSPVGINGRIWCWKNWSKTDPGWLVHWCLTALSTMAGYTVPIRLQIIINTTTPKCKKKTLK